MFGDGPGDGGRRPGGFIDLSSKDGQSIDADCGHEASGSEGLGVKDGWSISTSPRPTVFRDSVTRDLRNLPEEDVTRILDRIDGLQEDPRRVGSIKLAGQERYRLRQGDYRILYSIQDEDLIIEIVKVVHRREVYRG
jgi:mRNA interferase RelE/StbE